MAGKDRSSSQQTFDPEIKNRLLQVFDQGQRLSQVPFQAYDGATVAPLAPTQLEGMQATADAARSGIGQEQLAAANAAAQRAAGFQPSFFNVNLGSDVPTVGAGGVSAQQLGSVGAVPTSTIGSTDVDARTIGGLPTIQAQSIGPTSAVGVSPIESQGIAAQQIGPLGMLAPERIGEAQAVATNQIGVDPVTAQQVQARTVGAQSLAGTDLSPYQNQFQTDVIDAALGDIERSRQMAQNQNRAAAVRAGAFGGDRQAILEAETNRSFADQAARTAATLRAQGFESAARRAEADVGRAQTAGLQTAQLGQQADLANQRAGLQAGTTSAQLGLQGQIESGRQGLQSGLAAQNANTQRMLANQRAGLTAGQQNLQAELARQQANQRASLQAAQDTAGRQQQASTDIARLGAQTGLAAQDVNARLALANQQAGLDAQGRNLSAELARQQANQQAGLTADVGSAERAQQAALDTARLAQQSGLAAQDINARLGLSNQAQNLAAQQTTAQLGLDAARANQQAALDAETQRRALEAQLALGREQQQLDALGINLRGAGALGQLGEQARDFAFRDAAALESVGDRQRAAAQELLEDRYRRFIEQRDAPLRAFDILRAGAGILPSPITQSTKSRGFNIL